MMKHHLLAGTLISFSLVTSQAFGQDLESILDEGAKAPAAQKAANTNIKLSPLADSIKKALGTPNSEQNIFLRFVESADWEKATLQFPVAFEGTAFQKSANGRAMQGFVQFQAGLPVTGVQTLFMAAQPREISSALRDEWRKAAPADHFVWSLAQVQWQPSWEVVFGDHLEMRLKTAELLNKSPNIDQLQKLSAEATSGSLEKAKLDWQLVVAYSMADQADRAAKLLANLMKGSQNPVSKDLMQITAARLLFQNGYFDASIKYYEKVSKNSDYWTEAQEEMGWAYIRKGEPNNAMAISQSLVAQNLNYQVSPEAFFVRSLSQLKVCDYSGVTETLALFPKRFKERTRGLDKLAQDAGTDDVTKAIALLKTKKIESQDLGKSAQTLPRRLAHDERLYQFAQAQKNLENEAAAAEKLYAKSLALTGLQGSFEKIKQNTLQRAQMAKNAAYSRVKELAKEEVAETQEILRKLHIVEAELIQQVSLADKIAKNAKGNDQKKGVTGYKGTADAIRFPADDEIWFDEISNYRVDVKKACTVKR